MTRYRVASYRLFEHHFDDYVRTPEERFERPSGRCSLARCVRPQFTPTISQSIRSWERCAPRGGEPVECTAESTGTERSSFAQQTNAVPLGNISA